MYPKEEIGHQLQYFGMLRGGEKKEIQRNIDYWLDRVNPLGVQEEAAGDPLQGESAEDPDSGGPGEQSGHRHSG